MKNERDPHYYSHARDDLIRLIPPGTTKILEVGCGAGMTGKALREKGFEKIVGIEINEEVARGGAPFMIRSLLEMWRKCASPSKKTILIASSTGMSWSIW
jgi:spermidine synthase